ncbi:MAG: ROK family transcriptional regulator [Faecalibacterium sp.]|nr:ROK family transcriptional regulator [Ruminococcus sp.]MCM1391835.1 ROK family transcriptional regulator [Ruminococcus sp.]MCM1485699.1 ROK family transcriptional regulator [Faecalibacterium sp.]
MEQSGLNFKEVKSRNISSILYLLNNSAMSRKDIAQTLGLTPAAVTKICNQLIEKGMIEEKGEQADDVARAGRKKILLSLKLADYRALCINAELDKITVSVAGLDGRLYESENFNDIRNVDKLIAVSKKMFEQSNEEKSKFLCTAICVIGSVRKSEIGLWDNDCVIKKLEKEIGLPVVMDNNVRAFALAELIYSHRIYENSVLFLKWGPGIGSAIAANGELLSGSDAGIAEIGHYIINRNGKKCRCNRYGCLETEVSSMAITEELGGIMTFEEIIKSSDESICNLMDIKIDSVALALTNTATILNAEKIILFGMTFENVSIADKLYKQCRRYNNNFNSNTIELSQLNDKITFIGPAALAAKHFFFERSNA